MIVEGAIADHMLARAVETLQAAGTMAQDRVFEVRDWPTRPEMFPLLMVQVPRERKASLTRGVPTFNTLVTLVVVGRVVGTTPEGVAAAARKFKCEIEDALLCTPDFVREVQQFASIETQIVVTADGKQHVGEIGISLEIEVYQLYEPNGGTPLTEIDGAITNDAGTYAQFRVPLDA